MNNTFTPTQRKPTCSLAPTPPTRKRSNEISTFVRASSMPSQLCTKEATPANTKHQNARFSIGSRESKNNDKISQLVTSHSSSSMVFDHASRQRKATAKSTVLTRTNSCDVVPSLPVRLVSPIKENKSFRNGNFLCKQKNIRSKSHDDMLIKEEESGSDSESPMIVQPEVKSNMFFKGLSLSRPLQKIKGSDKDPLTSPSVFLKTRGSPANLVDAARLGASEVNDSDFLHSRWSSSSSLTSVRLHESISSSMEFFLDESSGELGNSKSNSSLNNSKSNSSLNNNSKNLSSKSSFRTSRERGVNRCNSSLQLEDKMLKRWG